jgi:hypothetical protein
VGLGAVLDHGHVGGARQLGHRVDVADLPVQVHGDHRARARRQRPLERCRVDRAGLRLDVAEHRRRAGSRDGGDRRYARVRLGHDLVARADAGRAQDQLYGVCPRRAADSVRGPHPRGELALELLALAAEQEPAAVQHARDRSVELRPQLVDRAAEVREGHAHGRERVARG